MPVDVLQEGLQIATIARFAEPDAKESFKNLSVADSDAAKGYTLRTRGFRNGVIDTSNNKIVWSEDQKFVQANISEDVDRPMQRTFPPLPAGAVRVIEEALPEVMNLVPDKFKNGPIEFGVHQIRITASPNFMGQPTPEKRHQDDMDHIVMILVDRQNVVGGVSSVFDSPDGQTPIITKTLEPGDALSVDDRRYYHEVTPVMSADGVSNGTRDIFVLTFRFLKPE